MSPSSLPQQRIVGIPEAFERPEPFESVIGIDKKPPGVRYPRGPYNPEYLGQVGCESHACRGVLPSPRPTSLGALGILVRRQLGDLGMDVGGLRPA